MDHVLVYDAHSGYQSTITVGDWLKTVSNQLEAIPCDEDDPQYYIVVHKNGYLNNCPRNHAIEFLFPDAVKTHTRCPTNSNPYAYVGLFGDAALVHKSYVPKFLYFQW